MIAEINPFEPAYEELPGYIYFIGCPEPMAIKIGYTRNDPRERLKQLQTGSPSELVLIGWYPGSPQDERDLHAKMTPYRLLGEWFRIDPEARPILEAPVMFMRIQAMVEHEAADG